MTKLRATIQTLIFFLVLTLPTLAWSVLGALGKQEALEQDTHENRNMHSFSAAVALSDLTAELEETYKDHVPFRSILLLTDRRLNAILEIPYTDGIEPALLSLINKSSETKDPVSASPAVSADPVTPSEDPAPSYTASDLSPAPSYSASDSSPDPAYSASDSSPAPAEHVHEYVLTGHADPDYENYGYDLYTCSCGLQQKEYIEKLIDESYFPFHQSEGGAVYGRYDWLFYKDTLADYKGSNRATEEEILSHVGVLTELDRVCREKGIELHYLILPNKNSIYPEYMPTYDRTDERLLEQVSSYIRDNTSLSYRYVKDELLAAKPYNELYYKHDTHWNSYGVLIGVNALYEMLGLPTIDGDSLTHYDFDHGLGDLASMTGEAGYANEMGFLWIYKPGIGATVTWNSNSMTLHHVASSEASDQRTVVVIGDSFCGNPEDHRFLDFLPRDFAHVVFIYNNYLEDADAETIRNADIIIVESVERRYIRVRPAVTKLTEMLSGD